MVKLLTHPTALFNPEIFQGKGKKRSYFEGWYFKLVNKAEIHALAIIPGVAFDKNGEGHSFIQVLDGKKKTSQYHRFPAEAFQFSPKNLKFELKVTIFQKAVLR